MNVADVASALSAPGARAAFVAAMQTPAAYAALHPVAGAIRCVETHVSWVFLTGPYAYKVKKPLRLSFLDYSTEARREWMCREELRLNRRHAPGLYVDVVPIGGRPDAPRVGDAGTASFEHALRMVQFDPDAELTHLLQAGDIPTGDIAALATDLWRMHGDAPRADPATPFGRPDRVHRVTLDNFEEIGRLLPAARDTESLADLQTGLERAFARLAARMTARKCEGYVRECHGDLHCGNVVRWRGRLVAFDGLEFDPALRFVDVVHDLAFLSMDLAAHGRADLRHALLDHWTAASGDYGAIELLPYYEASRALVRAKVAAVRGRQTSGAAVDAESSVHRYLAWERRQAARRAPSLVVMAGLSGSGKTWLARQVAQTVDALHLRSDVERKRLAGLGALAGSGSAPDAGIYTRDFNARTYARLRECAAACLRGGESVVVDAANLRLDEREAFVRLAGELGCGVHLVLCHAPMEVLRQRIATRVAGGTDASEATVDLLDRQPSYWEPLSVAQQALTATVDTTRAAEVDAVLRRLARVARRDPA